MPSIKEKLRALDALSQARKPSAPVADSSSNDSLLVLDAQPVTNEFGQCLLRRKAFPVQHVHSLPISEFTQLRGRDFALIGKNLQLQGLTPEQVVFMDTETTGLAGGTGTLAFLVGMGRFVGDGFEVKQYFLRDFGDESALLHELSRQLQDVKGIISFNGKSYDLPLLRTRFILNRREFNSDSLLHLDLLHAARRLWKKKLTSFNLRDLEAGVLGFRREGDIPSSQIPSIFFQCIQSKDLRGLKPILQHNVMDILSMLALMIKASRTFDPPKVPNAIDYDVLAVVKTLEQLGLDEQAGEVYDSHLPFVEGEEAGQLMLRNALRLKRLGRYQEAETVWQVLIERGHFFSPDAYLELAKCYEHRFDEIEKALLVVDRLRKRLDISIALKEDASLNGLAADLELRRTRLLRKMQRRNTRNLEISG